MIRPLRKFFNSLLILPLILILIGCGKYGPPLPPEVFAPASVDSLAAVATDSGVIISWFSPRVDRRGRELRSIKGYRVFRVEESVDETEPPDFTELAFLPDTHIEVREQLREEARERGEIVRRVRVDSELTTFEFFDSEVMAGHSYTYKVVPVGRGIEGDVNRQVQVLFRGETSEIEIVGRRDFAF